jgi:hypothetical protein
MRQIIISDSHTGQNIDFIFSFIRDSLLKKIPIDSVVLNGDLLGEDKARPGYGYRYNKHEFESKLDRKAILRSVTSNADALNELALEYHINENLDDEKQVELAKEIKVYVEARYDFLFRTIMRFTGLLPTYYNVGTYESPLQYKVLNELSYLLGMKQTFIRKVALLERYSGIYHEFIAKLVASEGKTFRFIGGKAVLSKNFLIAGIPGLYDVPVPIDSQSELQEKMTLELLSSVKRQLSYTDNLIIFNAVDCKKTENPFSIKPGSPAVRQFIEDMKGKLRNKVFVQSYNHWITTHFYERDEFNFMLNNAAVNNCLFNILEVSNKIRVFDVDPRANVIRELKRYNSFLVEYSSPKARLGLNYEKPDEIIAQRDIEGCYYM